MPCNGVAERAKAKIELSIFNVHCSMLHRFSPCHAMELQRGQKAKIELSIFNVHCSMLQGITYVNNESYIKKDAIPDDANLIKHNLHNTPFFPLQKKKTKRNSPVY